MENKIQTKAILRVFWEHLRPYKRSLIVSLVCVIAASLVDIVSPVLYKRFIDLLSGGVPDTGDVSAFVGAILLILIAHMFGWVAWRTAAFIESWRTPRVQADLVQTSHQAIHKHSYQFFSDNFAGSLVRKVGRIERAYDMITEQVLWKFLPLTVILSGYLIVLFLRNPLLGWILLGWLILFLTFNTWFSLWKTPHETKRAELDSEATGVLADSISNSITTKLFTGFDHERGLYRQITERLRKMQTFTWNLNEAMDAIQSAMMFMIEFVMMYVAIRLWQKGLVTIGDFALIQGYLINMFSKVWDFGRAIRRAYEAFADADQMVRIINQKPDVVDVHNAKKLDVQTGRIEFQNVYFSFNKTRRILKGLDLVIEPGEKIALVGPSGAGKSTITKLLLRFYDIERGKIILGNQNIAKVTQESLREAIAVVPQEPILFHRTVMENIRYGKRDATDEQVIEAAKKARCHEFITELQDGYNTYVGERGVKLSGGERQRIAIARAILKDAPILILDEATSSLDSESEHLIQLALHELMEGKTSIVIAHRLSTIMEMDRIIVIEDGKVADDGTHAELIKRKQGIYKNLWEIQAGGFLN